MKSAEAADERSPGAPESTDTGKTRRSSLYLNSGNQRGSSPGHGGLVSAVEETCVDS